ncbi:MAG: hypothetical protein KAR40_07810 [Candidatus Sabulitectum sp.]|nr:hypothetical protein [Candidatus Sabulitectum sp.]
MFDDEVTAERYGSPEGIVRVLQSLRSALTELFQSAGVNPSEIRASARELGLSKDIFWRVARITIADNMFEHSNQIPPRASVERVVSAVEQKGVSAELVRNVRDAMEEFEIMVASSSTDRTTFELMLPGLSMDNITQRQESIRKQAFLSNSSIWGVQAQIAFKAFFMIPSKNDENMLDLANISGLIDFRRLRKVAWPIYQRRIFNDKGATYSQTLEPIEKNTDAECDLPVITEFCSRPLPRLSWRSTETVKYYEIEPDLIGNSGAITCILGGISRRSAGRYRDENNDRGGLIYELSTPVKKIIVDLFVHRELQFKMPPDVILFDRMSCLKGYSPDLEDRKQLPLSNRVLSLGPGTAGCSTHHIPEYLKMLDRVTAKIGCSSEEFNSFRFTLNFPPIPTAIVMRFDLPDAPDNVSVRTASDETLVDKQTVEFQ